MAIRSEDWQKINEAIETAVAPLKPRGWKKALVLLREWSVLGVTAGIIVALLGMTATAFYQATARVEKQTKFQSDTENSLNGLKTDIAQLTGAVAKLTFARQASLPLAEFKATLPELQAAVVTLRHQNLTVSSQSIEDVGQRLSKTDSGSPSFWPAAAEFISYRSEAPLPASENLPECTDKDPVPAKIIDADVPTKLTRKMLGFKPQKSHGYRTRIAPPYYENCRFTLDSQKADEKVNSILQNHFTFLKFIHCLVVYRGRPMHLIVAFKNRPTQIKIGKQASNVFPVTGDTLVFENCKFDFAIADPPPEPVQEFARNLLTKDTSMATYRIPAAPST